MEVTERSHGPEAATMRRYATTDFAYLRSLTSRLSGANPASVWLKPMVRLLHVSFSNEGPVGSHDEILCEWNEASEPAVVNAPDHS